MSKPLLVLGAFLVWAAASTYWYDCNVKRVCDTPAPKSKYAVVPSDASATKPTAIITTTTPTTASATVPPVSTSSAASGQIGSNTSASNTALIANQTANQTAAQPPGPLSFMWADPGPIMSSAFTEYKRAEIAKLGATEQLEIIGLYSAAEQITAGNPTPNLGLARAEKTAALFADAIPKDRLKLSAKIVADDSQTEATKRAGFFASVDLRRTVDTSTAAIPAVIAVAPAAPTPVLKPTVAPPPEPTPITKTIQAAPATTVSTSTSAGDLKVVPIRFRIRTTARSADPEIEAYLKKVAARIKAGSRATITGFTDVRGNPDNNRKLAETRAESIRTELISMGAQADRIEITSKGSDNPTADNDTVEGRHNNRRVEITLK
jgi:outer membrane protein OmpA-like peptidoglycan-associated protein